MKKILLAAMMLLGAVAVNAQKAVITGKVKGLNENSHVFLMNIAEPENLQPVTVGADGSYRLELDAPDGYARFLIVDAPKGGVKFYVQNGMKANIDLEIIQKNEAETESKVNYTGDYKDCYEFVNNEEYYQTIQTPMLEKYYGKGENLTFAQWRQEMEMLRDRQFAKLNKISNPVFRKFMREDINTKLEKGGLSWFAEIGSKADDSYLAWLDALDRDNNVQEAMMYASGYKKFLVPDGQDKSITLLNNLNNLFTNKEIVNKLADNEVANLFEQAPANINDIYAAYCNVTPGREIPAQIQGLYDHYKTMVPGAKAVNFDMYDMNGKKLTLANLKGKAVYIDCWATWCGPCKAETPNMVKLYNHFKNDKRIQLVSISLDKNQAAWKSMVKKENLSWPQYIVKGEFDCMLCKEYGVTGIPRFMMFDKKGNIISLDAPRPSAPNIIEWIESNLK